MTRHFKRTLDFDAPGSDRATSFAYQRATLNGALKTELVNDCLSDAVAIYLMANQIPLLDIASPMPPASSLDEDDRHDARGGWQSPERVAAMAAPTVVAFTDPNDLLSYRLCRQRWISRVPGSSM